MNVDPGLAPDHRLQDHDLDQQVLVPNHDQYQEVDQSLGQLVQDHGKMFICMLINVFVLCKKS